MAKEKPEDEIELFVAGLVLDPDTNAPIVVLKDAEGDKGLPIWIGLGEATAIASAIKKVPVVRPMTHDLLQNMIEELGGRLVKVCINDLQENTFVASLEIAVGEVVHVVDARPSDAIALSVRVNAPIYASRKVLDQAQVRLVAVGAEDAEDIEEIDEIQRSQGADFANIDKDKWAEILDDMDPDDFKYKM